MRKFTKQISSLLAVVAAGTVTGSIVNARNLADNCRITPLAGLVPVKTSECVPEAGVAIENPETEITPTAGVPILTRPEEYTTTGTTEEVYPIGTQTSSLKTEPDSEVQRGSGDIDMNGKTEVTDLTTLSLYMLKDKTLNEKQLEAADLTKDGQVNLPDLAHLKMIIVHDDVK